MIEKCATIKVDKRRRKNPNVRLVAYSSNNLSVIRKQCGLEQTDVANYLGVKQSSVSHYESGRANPDVKRLAQLSALFSEKLGYKIVFYIAPENEEAPPEYWGG